MELKQKQILITIWILGNPEGAPQIRNPDSDSPKGTHPKFFSLRLFMEKIKMSCCIPFPVSSISVPVHSFSDVPKYHRHNQCRHLWFRKPKLTVPFIWIGSLVSMSVFLVIQTLEDYNNSSVYTLGDPDGGLRGIYLLLFVVDYLIPLAVISFLYTITSWKLWFHVAPGVNTLRGNRKQLETSKRIVIRMLIIVTCAFSLCWLPPRVVHMMQIIHTFKAHQHI